MNQASSSDVISQIRSLESRGYLRESLILRLSIAGLRLNDICALRLRDVFSDIPPPRFIDLPELGQLQFLRKPSWSWDRVFDDPGVVYSLANLLFQVASFEDHTDPSQMDHKLFASRKGSQGITPRTAQRNISAACKSGGFANHLSARDVRRLSQTFPKRQLGDWSRVEEVDECAWQVVERIGWFFRQSFRNEHDREDAIHETWSRLARRLRSNIDQAVSSDDPGMKQLALEVARKVRAESISTSKERSEVLFFDFSLVLVDSIYAKVLTAEEREELRTATSRALNSIDPRKKRILKLRFGFETAPMPIAQIAKMLNLSPTRVHQIEPKALKELKECSHLAMLQSAMVRS